jgi:hypothetical protein
MNVVTAKDFIRAVANGETDIIQLLLGILDQACSSYCVVGGLGVNAYVEPVVSLDLDVVVAAKDVNAICTLAARQGLRVEKHPHSVNLASLKSELRIQLQTDPRYQAFIPRSVKRTVLGYELKVAALEDILEGKLWAYQDDTRRKSKRQKDLADIARLVEAYPELKPRLPDAVRKLVE